jgi:hypothetical protein
MGVASLVLGIFSIVCGFIPLCNFFALIPAVVGLVLGIVSAVGNKKRQKPNGMAIAGAIMSGIAILSIIFWLMIFAGATASASQQIQSNLNEIKIEVKKAKQNQQVPRNR